MDVILNVLKAAYKPTAGRRRPRPATRSARHRRGPDTTSARRSREVNEVMRFVPPLNVYFPWTTGGRIVSQPTPVPTRSQLAHETGFTMYTTCVIWLAFVPLYFGTASHVPLRVTSMAVTISLSASVTLVCLFSPKLYIILVRPERNVRQSIMPVRYSRKPPAHTHNHFAVQTHAKPLCADKETQTDPAEFARMANGHSCVGNSANEHVNDKRQGDVPSTDEEATAPNTPATRECANHISAKQGPTEKHNETPIRTEKAL
ncbi:Metabotropic glutamate receptor [Eumeta japonica]|uniref:Metabotropic glutamate receptor n=1 Tax=Eumeta variegata TaxID=151549 RepID=A0A4C1Z5I9_EUMVA|nr:Metabotropic glutamate receptor [Eumeta japonica]